ncbi:MAG: hypothetical protein KDC18_03070 [Alphaproteobacteria bacterium]|nr:hypothetical protein [Alphaproteobacteria bacterium]
MSGLAELLDELFERDDRLHRDLRLFLGLTSQERHFLSRTARFWDLPPTTYVQSLIRCGGDPLIPSRPEE